MHFPRDAANTTEEPWRPTELATKVDLAALPVERKGEIAALRDEFKHDLASVKTSIEVSQFASMIGLAGLVFAVATFVH